MRDNACYQELTPYASRCDKIESARPKVHKEMRSDNAPIEEIPGFFLHLLIATIGVFFVDVIVWLVFSVVFSLLGIHASLGTAYNPFFWIPALITGFLVNRRLATRSAALIGVLGAVFLLVIIWWDASTLSRSEYFVHLTGGHYWRYAAEQPLSPSDRDCGSSECLGKVFFTVPAVISVAYSVGAWLGLEVWRQAKAERSVVVNTAETESLSQIPISLKIPILANKKRTLAISPVNNSDPANLSQWGRVYERLPICSAHNPYYDSRCICTGLAAL
jgi:hypothetical protein